MNIDWKTIVAIGGVGLLVYFVLKREAGSAAEAIGGAINPVSQDNLIYSGVSTVVDSLDDANTNNSASLGTWLYDVTHPNEGG